MPSRSATISERLRVLFFQNTNDFNLPMSYSLHTKTLKIDQEKLHRDLITKLNKLNMPQRKMSERLNVSRSTLYLMSKGRSITLETYLKAILWLDKPANSYIKEEK